MLEKKPVDDGGSVEVMFVLPAAQTTGPVSVAGDFNDWSPDTLFMRPTEQQLVASIVLRTGRRYAFRYFSDGEWFNDEQADGYERNEFGGYNSVIDLRAV